MSGKIYYYNNFNIDVNNGSLEIILWSIYAGIVLGVLASVLYRMYTGTFIRAMVDAGALDSDHAVTLDQLKFKGKWYIKRQLKPGGPLFRLLECTNADDFPQKKCSGLGKFWHEKFLNTQIPIEVPFETAKFYLPEEKRIGAELRFTVEQHPVRTVVLSAVIFGAIIMAAIFVLPELLQMLDNLITQLTPTDTGIL